MYHRRNLRRCVAALNLIAVVNVPIVAAQPNVQTVRRLVEEFRIDGVKEDFTMIGFLLVLSDKSIVVSQPQDSRLIFFDASGKRITNFGRSGSGPGEFGGAPQRGIQSGAAGGNYNPGPLLFGGVARDTVWVYDFNARRLTFAAPKGTLLRTTPLNASALAALRVTGAPNNLPLRTFRPLGILPNGDMVGRALFGLPDDERAARSGRGQSVPDSREDFVLASTARGTVSRIMAVPGDSSITVSPSPGRSFGASVPFLPVTHIEVSQDGSRIGVVSYPGPITATPNARLTLIGAGGDTLMSRTIPVRGKPNSRGLIDTTVERFFQQYYVSRNGRAPSVPRNIAEDLEAKVRANVPSHRAPQMQLLIGVDNSLLLATSWTTAGDEPVLMMLDAMGRPEARVVLPPNVGLLAASREHIWGTQFNSDGIPSVIRYRIQ